jgi:hypothetical protein
VAVPVAACVALAILSLLGPSEPTYDPWSWILWGREIAHLDLVTTGGPSWKPLPVLFTAPFSLAGDVAPELWLVVARAGGLAAIVLAYRLATRVGGRGAGLVAAGGLLLADDFVRNFARGNSEGLLVALCLWAVERHLDGARRQAFLLGVAAGLLRPEVWPFLVLYGALLMRDREQRALVIGAGVATAAAWFVPEYVGSGDFLRAAARARDANLDSAAHAARPFLEVFDRSSAVLAPPLLIGAAVCVVWPRTRTPTTLALGAGTAVLMIAVGAMTEAGFAGNLRYVALPAALACVLAGVAVAALVRVAAERGGRGAGAAVAVVLAAAALPLLDAPVERFGDSWRAVRSEADFTGQLDEAVALAGGGARMRACGGIFTTRYQVPAVAWHAHAHIRDVGIHPLPPGTSLAPRNSALARDPRFMRVGETSKWIVRRACG